MKERMGYLQTGNYATDLTSLYKLAKKELKDTKVFSTNLSWEDEQLLFSRGDSTISCTRGACTLGFYECWEIQKPHRNDPERFETPEEVINFVKKNQSDGNGE